MRSYSVVQAGGLSWLLLDMGVMDGSDGKE
jgi:hypothetical protein